jgi:hypothetical protein
VPSASRTLTRLALAACCGSLLLGAAAGCSTTQDKAAAKQAESKRILDARAERQKQRKAKKNKGKAEKGKAQQDGGTNQ